MSTLSLHIESTDSMMTCGFNAYTQWQYKLCMHICIAGLVTASIRLSVCQSVCSQSVNLSISLFQKALSRLAKIFRGFEVNTNIKGSVYVPDTSNGSSLVRYFLSWLIGSTPFKFNLHVIVSTSPTACTILHCTEA